MRAVLQRVTRASVTVDGEVLGKIGKGFMILLGVENSDTEEITDKMADKICKLRIFEDENGISFKVRDLLYDNIYHFGCCDEYLATILEKQDFFNKAKIIVEDKYQQKFTYDEDTMVIEIIYDDTNNQITTNEISQMISEVLNMADAPKVIYPDNQEFSTGVVNYYTLPTFGMLQCYIKRNGWGVTERFYVSDKVLEQSKIKEKIDKLYESTEK